MVSLRSHSTLNPHALVLALGICLFLASTQEAHAILFPFEDLYGTLDTGLRRTQESPTRRARTQLDTPQKKALKQLPRLQFDTPAGVDQAWQRARDLKSTAKQLLYTQKERLINRISMDLQSITSLGKPYLQTFARRDYFRNRTYATPELLAVLKAVLPKLQERLPGETIMVGDLAQPGGGLLAFGTTVRFLTDLPLRRDLSAFAETANLEDDALVRRRVVDPYALYPSESVRWDDIEGPILVEERMTGVGSHEGQTMGRVETRRFYRSGFLEKRELGEWWGKRKKSMRRKYLVQSRWVQRGQEKRWQMTWIRRGNLLMAEFTKRPRRSPQLADCVFLKRGNLNRKKPGALQQERQYHLVRGEPNSQQLIAWRQLYEAGHISHHNGFDADISYIMEDTKLLFSRTVSAIAVAKTRQMFRALYEAAVESGVQLKVLLVDRRVRRRLLRGMSEEEALHPVWKLLQVSRGHDSHVHVRIEPGFLRTAHK